MSEASIKIKDIQAKLYILTTQAMTLPRLETDAQEQIAALELGVQLGLFTRVLFQCGITPVALEDVDSTQTYIEELKDKLNLKNQK